MHLTLRLKHVLGHRTSRIKPTVGMFTELCLFMFRLLKIEYHWKTCRIGRAAAEISADTLTDVWLETQCFQKNVQRMDMDSFINPNKKIPWQSQEVKTSRHSDVQWRLKGQSPWLKVIKIITVNALVGENKHGYGSCSALHPSQPWESSSGQALFYR